MEKVHENGRFEVIDNGADEIILCLRNTNVRVRVTAQGDQVEVTAAGHMITPFSVNGLPSFRISE